MRMYCNSLEDSLVIDCWLLLYNLMLVGEPKLRENLVAPIEHFTSQFFFGSTAKHAGSFAQRLRPSY